VLALVAVWTATGGSAAAPSPGTHPNVTPATGSRSTTFVLGFRVPERTGGSTRRHDAITAYAHAPAPGCITTLDVRVPDARAGTRVRVPLAPRRLGGRWCPGAYHGALEERRSVVCPPGRRCPPPRRVILGRFVLHVRAPSPPASADATPPSFAGLQRAFACTPGPQRSGQTTPYTLSWQAASDDVSPSSQIVYDVYLASTSGAENLSTPTWTTPAGVSSYRTPGLPSHGSAYFVVRARDGAGNRDGNSVERRGVDPCY
jgi:hypothetical protein